MNMTDALCAMGAAVSRALGLNGTVTETCSRAPLTIGNEAGAIISRVAGSPGRRVAGSPGRRVALPARALES